MSEAKNHGGHFDGCVGTLEEEQTLGSFAAEFVEETPSEHRIVQDQSDLEKTDLSNDCSLFIRGLSDHDKATIRDGFGSRRNSLYPCSWLGIRKAQPKTSKSAFMGMLRRLEK